MTDTGEARLSAAAASRATGVARSTIQRRLKAGDFPRAVETAEGWRIPISDLLRAGYQFDADPAGHPVADGHADPVQHGQSHPGDETVRGHALDGDPEHDEAGRVQRLEAELLQVRHALDMERLRREAAEQVAAERDRLIEVLSRRALPAPAESLPDTPAETATEAGSTPVSEPLSSEPPSWGQRWRQWRERRG